MGADNSKSKPDVFSFICIGNTQDLRHLPFVTLSNNFHRFFAHSIQIIVHFSADRNIIPLAIHKNWNGSILGVVPSTYRNTVGNLTLQIWFRYQPSYRISESVEGKTLKITGGINPWFK